jgi:hypothetical protein
MKKILIIIPALLLLILNGCTKGFEEINTNKHEFVNVQPEYLLASSVKGSINLIAELNANVYWQYSHQLTVSSMASTSSYGASYTNLNTWWRQFYENIALLRQIQSQFSDVAGYENRVQIAKIWESYLFFIFTTTFGGIPYKDACREGLIEIPFDNETDIYISLLNVLKTAMETLDPSKDAMLQDVVFPDKDVNKWKKFAAALRLKIALETQNAIPTEAAQHGTDVLTNYENLLLKSNTENLFFKWGGTNTTENSYYYNEYLFTTNKDLPALTHLMFIYMRSYPDLRMQAIFDRNKGQFLVYDSLYTDATLTTKAHYRYEVPYNGKPKTTQKGGLEDNEGYVEEVLDPLRSMNPSQYSYIKTDFLKANAVQNLIWYADVCFMQAEAKLLGWGGTKSVEEYYNDGITASFTQYGLSVAQANTYKDLNGVKWNTEKTDALPDHFRLLTANIPNDPLHKIIVQRWLAGIFHGSHDAYCYIRRTRKIELLPHFAPSTDAMGVGTKVANLPERLQYPSSEIQYNGVSYKNAVQKLQGGFDFMSSYLKMAAEYNRRTYEQWTQVNLKVNNDAWIKWYGQTEQDLINAGLVKNINYFNIN